MKPRVLKEFLSKYDGHKFPREDIANRVLAEMGVASKSTERVLKLIQANAAP